MTPQQTELTKYLSNVIKELELLDKTTSKRNRTKKFKAIASIITIVRGRANATYQYVRAGGHGDFSVVIQSQMYDPIIQWLKGEIE